VTHVAHVTLAWASRPGCKNTALVITALAISKGLPGDISEASAKPERPGIVQFSYCSHVSATTLKHLQLCFTLTKWNLVISVAAVEKYLPVGDWCKCVPRPANRLQATTNQNSTNKHQHLINNCIFIHNYLTISCKAIPTFLCSCSWNSKLVSILIAVYQATVIALGCFTYGMVRYSRV